MKLLKKTVTAFALIAPCMIGSNQLHAGAIQSIETGHTITKVRYAMNAGKEYIIGSTYQGMVMCYDTDGNKQWENPLSGYMNQDITCGDIDGDNKDEILASNADGSLYCIDDNGELKWTFKKNDAPMNSACIFKDGNKTYIACGGYDLNFYYLNADGTLKSTVKSTTFSKENSWGSDAPPKKRSTVNFLRTLKDPIFGSDLIVMHGVMHSMSSPGTLYVFQPNNTSPYKTISLSGSVFGSFSIDSISSNTQRILMGNSSMIDEAVIVSSAISNTKSDRTYTMSKLTSGNIDNFGYRVVQVEPYMSGNTPYYFVLYGSRVVLTKVDNYNSKGEIIAGKYSYNDLCKSPTSNKMTLASAQSGGSCIHIIDLDKPSWKTEYKVLTPKGKISSIISNTAAINVSLKNFVQPEREKGRRTVYFLSDFSKNSKDPNITAINKSYETPAFLRTDWTSHAMSFNSWNRDTLSNKSYRNRKDGRRTYDWNLQQALNWVKPLYVDSKGMSVWGGHGNDPFMFSPDALKQMMDMTKDDQKTVLLFPEIEATGSNADWLVNTLLYPLAKYAKDHNSLLYIRSKNVFWEANVYEHHWGRLVDGDFPDVFIPAMEETTDKTMEMSISGRMGVWCSGAVNQWGGRCARDNASFDRLRQHSHQMLPNHFLRAMVYQISLGATYLDNFAVDQKYMNTLWQLIAKGLLYVPNRDEIVSINPVHLSMLEPDDRFLDDGSNVKWTTFYNEQEEKENIMVFSRMNGTWPGAANTQWDFSRYAAGVKDRRLNFLPPYKNGLVLMTPPSAAGVARGKLTDHLNPLYKNITKEYFTDGRNYYTDAKKSKSYPANTFYTTIENEIKAAAKKLPLTVEGEVAWVNAVSGTEHLRLTIIDGGYINPSDKEATIYFHTVVPASIKNLATGEEIAYDAATRSAKVSIPCGLFVFLDITLGDNTSVMPTPTSSVEVRGATSKVVVRGAADKAVSLINLAGEVVYNGVATDNNVAIPAPRGLMIAKVEDQVFKVVVQ